MTNQNRLSRRMFLGGSIGVAGLASSAIALSASTQSAYASPAISNLPDLASTQASKTVAPATLPRTTTAPAPPTTAPAPPATAPASSLPFMAGDVDPRLNGFDPAQILTSFDPGTVSRLPNGQTLRQYTIISTNKTFYPAPGKPFPGWTFNGRVPGPTIRATAGDRIRIHFINRGNMAHGLHFHGIHAGNVDGAFMSVIPGSETFYEFDAQPFGVHVYHCLMSPLKDHIQRGLYGFFIIDPPATQPRPLAKEFLMMMNGVVFNDNVGEVKINDLYAINTVAYHFLKHPIPVAVNQPIRLYVASMVEFDRVTGFQMENVMFNHFPTGTSLQPSEVTNSVLLCQGQRSILEFTLKSPGQYLFRAMHSLGADRGFIGAFQAK
jgi:FtsP/CotA-like multicopper oxidase with cupredoxin domain